MLSKHLHIFFGRKRKTKLFFLTSRGMNKNYVLLQNYKLERRCSTELNTINNVKIPFLVAKHLSIIDVLFQPFVLNALPHPGPSYLQDIRWRTQGGGCGVALPHHFLLAHLLPSLHPEDPPFSHVKKELLGQYTNTIYHIHHNHQYTTTFRNASV